MARILTRKMEESLKQPVVIENRAGAGGGIAATAVARAAPDGHTILLATGSSLAINVSLYKNSRLRSGKGFRTDQSGRHADQSALHASGIGAGKDARRVRGLREGQSGQAQLRLGRHRHAGASGGRTAEGRGRHRHDARAVPRHRAGVAERHRRAYSDRVQSAVAVAAASGKRRAARHRGHHAGAHAGVAQCADHRRERLSGLRRRHLACHRRAGRHAQGGGSDAAPRRSARR